MKNDTNIYDKDMNLIRAAGDNHHFTLEEVEKMVDELAEKVKNNPDDEVYKVYLNNAQKWLQGMYAKMDRTELFERFQHLIKTEKQPEKPIEIPELNELADSVENKEENGQTE